jgi:hypothetical protein
MSQKLTVKRMIRSAQALPAAASPGAENAAQNDEPATDPSEPRELAREMHRAVKNELERLHHSGEELSGRPDPRKPLPDHYLKYLEDSPPEQISFFDLERIASVDPALMLARWEKVKQTACENLAGGWMNARALEFMGGSAWERACFAAIRQSLRRAWPPRNDGEALLIDQMAQYELMRQNWVGILSLKSRQPQTITSMESKQIRGDSSRKATAIEATLEAVRMVERLQRLYDSALRTLMSLRRVKTPPIYGPVGQVNVAAGPQINIQAPDPKRGAMAAGGMPDSDEAQSES